MNQHPTIAVANTRTARILDIIGLMGLIFCWAIAFFSWSELPEIIPVHFGIDGRPDGWGSKFTFWLFPVLSSVIFFSFNWLRRYPHTFNYPVRITPQNTQRQYQIAVSLLNWLKTECVLLLVYIESQIFQLANNQNNFASLGVMGFMGLIFLTIAVFLYQAFQAS